MKFLRKGFALFAGLMLLSNVFLPSAVVFAEEGTPLAATEQVNQVTQAEETASVEENSTLEVSPEKVASESSEALAPEAPKAEEGSETPAEKVNQEAKEEQKAEPASDLATSLESKKTEPASESEEGRGETSTPAQQGGGDAGSSDSVVATPEDKQPTEEKKVEIPSQPSMIADRSNEGQLFELEKTTFRGSEERAPVIFYSSKGAVYPAGADNGVFVDGKKVDIDKTKKLYPGIERGVEKKVKALNVYEIHEIDGIKVLFLKDKDSKGAAQVFVGGLGTNLN